MSKILPILSIFLLLDVANSQALLIDSEHGILSSLNVFVDTENIKDEQTGDYDRKISSLSEVNFSYVYNRTLEINLTYKKNPSTDNGFMIPFEGAASSFGMTYHAKNIFKKLGVPVKGRDLPVFSGEDDSNPPSIIMPFDFNLNFNIQYAHAIDYDYSCSGYGLGISWEISEQSLINNYTIYPLINYMLYEYEISEESISYDVFKVELLVDITIPPKDNQEVRSGFFVIPSATTVDSKDAFFGFSIGIYHKI